MINYSSSAERSSWPAPVNADAQATRRRVLESASRLFSAHGTGGTTVREVARGAGVSLGMVHHYFGTKDALYQACLDDLLEELGGLQAALYEALDRPSGTVDSVIEPVVRAGFAFARDRRPAVRLLMRSIMDTGENEASWMTRSILPFLETMSSAFGSDPDRSPDAARLAAQSVVNLVVRYALTTDRELALVAGSHTDQATDPTDAQIQEAVRRVEDHLVDAARALLTPPA